MSCLVCGSRIRTKRENYRYEAVGLPGITLQDVEVSRCGKCGEYEVSIPRIEDLHQTIAQTVISKNGRLTPAEIRFLRKHLGWTGAEFAVHFGAARETVSRWENGSVPMGPTAERLLRMIVANPSARTSGSLSLLKPGARPSSKPFRIGLKVANGEWKAKAA
jgi:putative zinc finger/helix-turn-helix YgiT family protein